MGTRISGDGHEVVVEGSLRDNGLLEIVVDGDTHRFTPADGNYTAGAASAKLVTEDGALVEEGPVSKDVRLADGTEIHVGAASAHAVLPDGTRIENTPTDGEAHLQIRINGAEVTAPSTSTTSIQFGGPATHTDAESDGKTEETKDDADEVVGHLSTAVIAGCILAWLLLDSVGIITAIAAMFLLIALIRATAAGVRTLRGTPATDGGEQEDADEEEDLEQQIEYLRDEYAAEDGDIDSIYEYERELDALLDDEDVDREAVEIERVRR